MSTQAESGYGRSMSSLFAVLLSICLFISGLFGLLLFLAWLERPHLRRPAPYVATHRSVEPSARPATQRTAG